MSLSPLHVIDETEEKKKWKKMKTAVRQINVSFSVWTWSVQFDVDQWKMTMTSLPFLLILVNVFYRIESRRSSLQCWKCEVTVESTEEMGVFLDGKTLKQFLWMIDHNDMNILHSKIVRLDSILRSIHWRIVMENVGNRSILSIWNS